MQIHPSQLHCLPHFVPALKLMFAEHCEDMDAKTYKRKMRLERAENQQKGQLAQ